MSKLWLIGLAASVAWTPAAIAGDGAPPSMAHGAHAPAPPAMHPGPGMHHPMPGPGRMKGIQRFGRGHVVPPHFRGKQFIVQDWRRFGFPAPMHGGHWIRYHDDALLIDGDGRVMDGRYGWDWDRRGDPMAYDDDRYDGDHDRDDDYDREDWDDDGRGHHDRGMPVLVRHGGESGGDCRRSCTRVRHMPPPPPHPGYGHGYGQGYGYGYGMGCGCGPVVITETITTTAPVVEMRTYYETVYEHRSAPRRHYRKPAVYSKPVVRRSVKPAYRAPAPRPGERG